MARYTIELVDEPDGRVSVVGKFDRPEPEEGSLLSGAEATGCSILHSLRTARLPGVELKG